MDINIYSYFVVPISYFSSETSFCLMPDNGDVLPLDKINDAVKIWSGEVVQLGNIPCYLCKAKLDKEIVLDMKIQTTEFMRREVYDYINNINKDIGNLIFLDAAFHLNMETVARLQINKMYAGRNLDDVYWLFPEFKDKIIADIEIL